MNEEVKERTEKFEIKIESVDEPLFESEMLIDITLDGEVHQIIKLAPHEFVVMVELVQAFLWRTNPALFTYNPMRGGSNEGQTH